MVVSENQGATRSELRDVTETELPEGDVTVAVEYSSLNYKDGLAVTGRGRVVRRFPMVPGIDLAGKVLRSDSADFAEGDRVLATGCGLGERHFGGYAGRARLPAGWLVAIPDGLTTKRAMAIGTAGFTAMLSLMALEEHSVDPSDDQPLLVTGAGGGVGSVAVALLAGAGHPVAAATGREALGDDLRARGAGPATRVTALGGSGRHGGWRDPGTRARGDCGSRQRRRVWTRRKRRASNDGDALHPARRKPARHRLERVSA